MPLTRILRRTSLRARIVGGVLTLLLLLTGLVVVEGQRLRMVRDHVFELVRAADALDELNGFARSVLDARRLAATYLASLDAAERVAATNAQKQAIKKADGLQARFGDRASPLRQSLGQYVSAFDQLVREARQRQAAIAGMKAAGASLTNMGVTLTTPLAEAGPRGGADAIRLCQAVQAFSLAAERYARTGGTEDGEIAEIEFGRINQNLDLVRASSVAGTPAAALVERMPDVVKRLSDSYAAFARSSTTFKDAGETLNRVGAQIDLDAETLRADSLASRDQTVDRTRATIDETLLTGMLGSAVMVALGTVMALAVSMSVGALIRTVTGALSTLAAGDLDIQVPGRDRSDEIGALAQAVQVLKTAEVQRVTTARETDEVRRLAEHQREARTYEQNVAAGAVAAGLARLASGDLTCRLTEPFVEDYEKLRHDFNDAALRLDTTMSVVSDNLETIRSGAADISNAADDRSHRRGRQVVSMEQAAATLKGMTASLKTTSAGTSQAGSIVSAAKLDAEQSSAIVGRAVQAMSGMQTSAQKISQIIGVMDEIAFQTNILALNAGVEAARAGEAGRGFAVVATEVRALAQRSAQAAKEIKALIATSAEQVKEGVDLVGQTGKALARIVAQVTEIAVAVSEIAASAQQQSNGLDEINTAIDHMDQSTRQDAATVEEAAATSTSLAQDADALAELIRQFKTSPSSIDVTADRPVEPMAPDSFQSAA